MKARDTDLSRNNLENGATNEATVVGKHRKSALGAAVTSWMNDEFPKKLPQNPHQSPSRKRESAVDHGLPSVKGSADSLFLVAQFSKLFLDRS
jgi:hypothetical protein